MRRYLITFSFLVLCSIILFNCNKTAGEDEKSPFQNIQNKDVQYVGIETCKSCHWQIYETYMQTGMGKSWGLATHEKSAADYSKEKSLVYDSIKDLYYRPFWDGDSLCIMEYKLMDGDTIHQRIEKVKYIVGSGQHTNSHIISINGYLHQAPITFYTQKGKWDLAPGFEKGSNTRFDRNIELECITCHNGYPDFVEGSFNKYNSVKLGIDCERCHGPGSLHVADKRKGNIIDTAKQADYTIVNPKRLNTEQQNNLCQRCHLQGVAVLNDGSTFFDFKPSQKLSNTMNVFMPVYTGDEQNMIMASHVERMKMSNCFLQSNKMSCITCHNPHVSVKFTPQEHFIKACNSCHENEKQCTENLAARNAKQNNCITCHMPKNGSIDIPHVAVTDHFIRRKPSIENKSEIAKFVKMQCYNQENPDARTRARAFLEFFERYQPQNIFLDSALVYLNQSESNSKIDDDQIRYFHLKKDYASITALNVAPKELSNAWTCFRIGHALSQEKKHGASIPYFQKAAALKPLYHDFQNALGNAFLDNHQLQEAKKVFLFILSEHPKYAEAHANLGYVFMQEKNWVMAKKHLLQAIQLNPNQTQSLINLAVVYYQSDEKNAIKPLLKRALKLEPNNEQVHAMMQDLN